MSKTAVFIYLLTLFATMTLCVYLSSKIESRTPASAAAEHLSIYNCTKSAFFAIGPLLYHLPGVTTGE